MNYVPSFMCHSDPIPSSSSSFDGAQGRVRYANTCGCCRVQMFFLRRAFFQILILKCAGGSFETLSLSLTDLLNLCGEKNCKCSGALNDDLEALFGSVSLQTILLQTEWSSHGDNSSKRGSDLLLLGLTFSRSQELT